MLRPAPFATPRIDRLVDTGFTSSPKRWLRQPDRILQSHGVTGFRHREDQNARFLMRNKRFDDRVLERRPDVPEIYRKNETKRHLALALKPEPESAPRLPASILVEARR